MRSALALARRGHGVTWPNPSVGCVIVANGRVVGRGRTADGGRPHAEAVALRMAGDAARGGTAYVTLEPCSHASERGPPCAQALVAAGIARAEIALGDPDPRVNGQGIATLRAAGIEVSTGLCATEAADTLAGFLTGIAHHRPLVTLKLATTLDGRIAARTGDSRWITGEPARHAAHMLRASHDAIMVGIGTVLADDPALTCRIEGARPVSPPLIRIVADSNLRHAADGEAGRDRARHPDMAARPPGRRSRCAARRWNKPGSSSFPSAPDGVNVDPAAALTALHARGLTRILVEGGARLAGALLRAHLVDRIAWFHAPAVMGSDGLAAAGAQNLDRVADLTRFTRLDTRAVGEDTLTMLARKDE